jgi:enterochelin esterase-like enzyme
VSRPRALAVGLFVLFVLFALAAASYVTRNGASATVTSAALARDMPISVFEPPSLGGCSAAPILVLFHGRGGDENQWMSGGILSPGVGIDAIAQNLIDAGSIPPLTIVSARIDDSYGVDSAASSDGYDHGPYGRYINDDLLPYVEQRFDGAGQRPVYLGGLSMGGYVALNVALDNPGGIAGVGALSPAFFVSPPADRGWMYSGNGSTSLLERADAGAADDMRIFLGVGTNDFPWISQSVTRLHEQLVARQADVSMTTVPGGHQVSTWHALAEPMLLALFRDVHC